ncbi:UPF0061-domain-containing protein [Dacryopinax primogenitus]|uniref:Selenoprotein O n=1 Tax=Dacryopinax primogenitus (strain DJM 731) TaxID=1858805 RepID=M5GG75_DACPD|nr:UPF0061-domain-containing protein [Dacryopinax primogenitus]EJU04998.1 UPF0061-domain-containing protein [Dacryopinax primogenitus]
MSSKLLPIASLPVAPPHLRLQNNLTSDPLLPSPRKLQDVQRDCPSVQRRARILPGNSHFSHISPLPIPFPFRIQVPDEQKDADGQWIEGWLSEREATERVQKASNDGDLELWKAKIPHEGPAQLLALSKACLRDCFPNLDVGDAFDLLGEPKLSPSSRAQEEEPAPHSVRDELTSILGGQSVLANLSEDPNLAYSPWSLRYCGHQFGTWAGQLGDGRAISILETPNTSPNEEGQIWELQLKGAGRTPFSRTADGLAVLRSSIREVLCSEAMHALGIPTSRCLSLVGLPEVPVERERTETAAICSRVAPSFIRIGNFEACNGPNHVFLFGAGGKLEKGWEGMRKLTEWTKRLLGVQSTLDMVKEVAKRNMRMCAAWQAYGFMHGVMNTDNISVLGLTIDYGPYAFMDIYDPNHICNHTDQEGRYSYRLQPTMIIFAIRALKEAISPLVGAEVECNAPVSEGWAEGADEEKIEQWKEKGMEAMKDIELESMKIFETEHWALMRKRLGLKEQVSSDPDKIVRPFLDLMDTHTMDFHSTFRALGDFRPSAPQSVLDRLVGSSCSLQARHAWQAWLEMYSERLEQEGCTDAERQARIRGANPRFVLRQWVLEEVIKRAQEDAEGSRQLLMKLLEMASNPFRPWGAEDGPEDEQLEEEVREERRFCEVGNREFLGIQCSCSS